MNMDIEQFERFLDRYGADFDEWPETVRADAVRLAERSDTAADLVTATRLMTTTLDALSTPAPAPGLSERILDAASDLEVSPPGESQPSLIDQVVDWITGAFWRPVGLAFVPLFLGFAVGLNVQEDMTDFESEVTILAFTGAEFLDEALDE